MSILANASEPVGCPDVPPVGFASPSPASSDSCDSSDLPPAKRARVCQEGTSAASSGEFLAEGEVEGVWGVLFGWEADDADVRRWLTSAFTFCGDDEENAEECKRCPWGLVQDQGGPCGVLSAIQAYVIKALLWDDSSSSCQEAADPSEGGSLLTSRFRQVSSQQLLADVLANVIYEAAPGTECSWAEVISQQCIVKHDFVNKEALAQWLVSSQTLKAKTSTAVVSFVCSLLLTRGVNEVVSDMDDYHPLVGAFGHCSQELVNLCIIGRAVSNAFDGDVTFTDEDDHSEDRVVLKGIHDRPPVGFLSSMESANFCAVGRCMKRPKYPVWVVGSESHYTLLFSEECSANHLAIPGEEASSSSSAEAADPCCSCCWELFEAPESDFAQRAHRLLHFNGLSLGNFQRPTLAEIDLRIPLERETEEASGNSTGDAETTACEAADATNPDSKAFADLLRTRWGKSASVLYAEGRIPRIV
eukprot:TRINITY_DN90402_c0_g1_i1.p1 TRINITY_DN90402_c0_g1~~TRINITY_DN90402_c0_g1_i1.p1  ORF type:complete len:474 (-),score=54.05 TRINITY_DN90402_c0_g1_i1:136-1557(-)